MPKSKSRSAKQRSSPQRRKTCERRLSSEYIRKEMHELKNGNPRVTSRGQAIAIGLNMARRECATNWKAQPKRLKNGRRSSKTRAKK